MSRKNGFSNSVMQQNGRPLAGAHTAEAQDYIAKGGPARFGPEWNKIELHTIELDGKHYILDKQNFLYFIDNGNKIAHPLPEKIVGDWKISDKPNRVLFSVTDAEYGEIILSCTAIGQKWEPAGSIATPAYKEGPACREAGEPITWRFVLSEGVYKAQVTTKQGPVQFGLGFDSWQKSIVPVLKRLKLWRKEQSSYDIPACLVSASYDGNYYYNDYTILFLDDAARKPVRIFVRKPNQNILKKPPIEPFERAIKK